MTYNCMQASQYIETLLESKNKQIIVVNESIDDKENLVEDLVSIIYSFSARMYGKRRFKNAAKQLEDTLNKLNEENIDVIS